MYEITFRDGDETVTHENIADAMVVGSNLRFATMLGESDSIKGGEIEKARSHNPLRVEIKLDATDDKITRRGCTFASKEPERGMVYLAFPNSRYEAHVGEIVRVRRQVLPT